LKRLSEKKTRAVAQDLINQKEKDRRDEHQNQCHDRGHNRFPTRRPGNLCNFRPHLLEKCEWISFRRQCNFLKQRAGFNRRTLFSNSNQARQVFKTPNAPFSIAVYLLQVRCKRKTRNGNFAWYTPHK